MKYAISVMVVLAIGCGSGLDEQDPDTHSFEVTTDEGPNGEAIRRVIDLGFVPEHQNPPRQRRERSERHRPS